MVDLSKTIVAKSDQLNADDLMGAPITITIENVTEGKADQPVAIFYNGCNGKPFYPCKSMRRVLVNIWGRDGKSYIGKSMTLYRDPNVKFGGIEVGGIRISHMSDMAKDMSMALQITKGKKALYKVSPLKTQNQDELKNGRDDAAKAVAAMDNASDIAGLEKITASPKYRNLVMQLSENDPETHNYLIEQGAKNAERLNSGVF